MKTLYERIDSLRAKPKHVRDAWVVGLSLGLTAVIFLGWAAHFGFSLSQTNVANLFSVQDENVPKSFDRVGDEFSEAWATFEYGVEDFNKTLDDLEAVSVPETPVSSDPSVGNAAVE